VNDDELMTTLRESFATVRSGTPVEPIVRRGRAVRARRRIPGAAAALAVAAGTAVAVTALVPGGSGPAAGPVHAKLAAWTVVKQADGTVAVTIRELRDTAALQARLRADGIAANVITGSQRNPCQPFLLPGGKPPPTGQTVTAKQGTHETVLLVHPAVIPRGAGIQLTATFYPDGGGWGIGVSTVTASRRCTGRR
jgi:hypothetical protein